jgi:hypothetical protein
MHCACVIHQYVLLGAEPAEPAVSDLRVHVVG